MTTIVASAEKNILNFKLFKNYLRSSMSKEKLNSLTILCIEKDMIKHIDIENFISEFATKNACRKCFV
jgi:hypothetical protein